MNHGGTKTQSFTEIISVTAVNPVSLWFKSKLRYIPNPRLMTQKIRQEVWWYESCACKYEFLEKIR